MSAEENKAVFLQFFDDVWGNRVPGDEWASEILDAFPDLKVTPDAVLAAEGGRVVIIFTGTGTHEKDFRGVPASGEPTTFQGITVARMEDGKIVDEFAVATKMGAVMFGQTLGYDHDTDSIGQYT